jgi:small-conductance mechanosensitive channel
MGNVKRDQPLFWKSLLGFVLAIIITTATGIGLLPSPGWTQIVKSDNVISRAPVLIDGRELFQIAGIQEFAANRRARYLNFQLADFVDTKTVPQLEVDASNYAPVIKADGQILITVTNEDVRVATKATGRVTESDLDALAGQWVNLIKTGVEQAIQEKSQAYYLQASALAVLALVAAAVAHRALGIFWRRYLCRWMDFLTFADHKSGTQTFSSVTIFLNLTLYAVRLSVWGGVLIYVTTLFSFTRLWSRRVQDVLTSAFTTEMLPIAQKSLSIVDLLTLFGSLLLVVIVARTVTNLLQSRILGIAGINRGTREAIAVIIRYLLIVIGMVVVLQFWGLDLSSLALVASALGIGIGLGLQNIAKDVGSGLVLVFERPIQVGDFIEFGNHMGTVEHIGVRSTEVRTLDHVSIIVPNSRFLDEDVINWSHRNPLSRIHIPVGVAYQSEPEAVRSILLTVGRQHPEVVAEPAPQVFFKGFGDSALNFDLLVWIRNPSKQLVIKSDLNFAIAQAFRDHQIEIPFPQRDLHLIDGDLPISLNAETQTLLAQFLNGNRTSN